MGSGTTPGLWLSPDGSGRTGRWWNAVSWRIALWLTAAGYFFFFLLLMQAACPIRQQSRFEVQVTDNEFQGTFCEQVQHLRWLMPNATFPVLMSPLGKDCEGSQSGPAAQTERIAVIRLKCGASAGAASGIQNGVRLIALCPTELNWTSLPHEYIHQLRGHVCVPWPNLFFNTLADFHVDAEIVFRVVWRTPIIGISILFAGLLIYGLWKFGRTIWEPRDDG